MTKITSRICYARLPSESEGRRNFDQSLGGELLVVVFENICELHK